MSWEYLHLVMHSFPIVLGMSGALVGLFGWWRDRELLELWGIVALLIAGAFVIPAYVSGLAAADVVADRIFVRPGVVQTHRFWATWAGIPMFTAGALAGFSLLDREDRRLRHFVLLVGLFAAALIGYTAWLGSRIEHPAETESTLLNVNSQSVDAPRRAGTPERSSGRGSGRGAS